MVANTEINSAGVATATDLLRPFAIARVANPKNWLNLVPNPLQYQNVSGHCKAESEKEKIS